MKTTVDRVEGRVPVTILRLDGDLDASNFEMVIDEGRRLYKEGARDLLLDLRSVPFMGSSGLVALHSLALIFNGKEPPDPESGWAAHHAFSQAVDSGLQPHIKILLPSAPDFSPRAHHAAHGVRTNSSTSIPTRPPQSPLSSRPSSHDGQSSRDLPQAAEADPRDARSSAFARCLRRPAAAGAGARLRPTDPAQPHADRPPRCHGVGRSPRGTARRGWSAATSTTCTRCRRPGRCSAWSSPT